MKAAAPFLDRIDWQRLWLSHVRAAAAPVLAAVDWRAALDDAARMVRLCNHRGLPIRFVPQAALPAGMAYEAFISDTGGVPTRDNLHDFFNALVWLTFPAIKAQLNALQAAEIASRTAQASMPDPLQSQERPRSARLAGARGKVRDAATIFDENAALLVYADDGWLDALRAHRWREALLEGRQAFGRSVGVFLFGHALMEKLVDPYKAITAHTWAMRVDAEFFTLPPARQLAWIDAAAARQLQAGLHTGDFTHLPVLGVPGWWQGQDAAFYADAQVFRPLRRKK